MQEFKSDEVLTYHWWQVFSNASLGASNSAYFLWPGNSWSWVTPNLSLDWYGNWNELFFGAVGNIDNRGLYWYGVTLPTSYWILIMWVNGLSQTREDYKNTVVAISKDPQDSRNLLG